MGRFIVFDPRGPRAGHPSTRVQEREVADFGSDDDEALARDLAPQDGAVALWDQLEGKIVWERTTSS